jgi:protein-S-isoprenylcysteine O-methyltransferase Ste14
VIEDFSTRFFHRQNELGTVGPTAVRLTLVILCLVLLVVGGYYRLQSERSRDRLDHSKEGWTLLIGIRLFGLLTLGCAVSWLVNPKLFAWASLSVSEWLRWLGVGGFGIAVAWLIWMFGTLGKNLTDTVVTRPKAYFVDYGPYRLVRNPMYSGVLIAGWSLGLALGTWLIPIGSTLVFTLLAIRTRTEERFLIERFGDRSREYMRRVGRFFPKVRRSTRALRR